MPNIWIAIKRIIKFKILRQKGRPLRIKYGKGASVEEWKDGSKFWFQGDKLHRLDGPAIEWDEGIKEWWQNGKRHRTDGPAVQCEHAFLRDSQLLTRDWWINGEIVTKEVDQWMLENNITYPFSPKNLVLFKLRFG